MNKIKVMTVVGTRPEVIRLSRVISSLDMISEHTLVHTGQNYDYELNQIFFDEMGIRQPNFFMNAATSRPMETIGKIIDISDQLISQLKPDAFLVLGDTNSSLAAISAKRNKVPIFHMEAGNRCFDMLVPEEINRKIVDHIADINLTYSTIARDYLLKEGIPPDRIIKIGSPMAEVLNFYKLNINSSEILNKLNLNSNKYFVVSTHREENVSNELGIANIVTLLKYLDKKFNLPIVISAHPRVKSIFDGYGLKELKNIIVLKPLGFFDYNKLQQCSLAVLSDSGTINEESSIQGFRALNLRSSHERPEAMEEGAVMMVGLSLDRIKQALDILVSEPVNCDFRNTVRDYSDLNISYKVTRIILSYIDYVNRVVWSR